MIHPNSFSKSEHLCGDKVITHLFTQGNAFIAFPLRVVYVLDNESELGLCSVLVGVPKKRFKRAVKRNRLKRLMREAYRLNKTPLLALLAENKKHISLAFQYVSNDEVDYSTMETKMKLAIQKLTEMLTNDSPSVL